MNDQEIKELLTSYMKEEMALLREEELPGYDYVYSKAYQKRIRRMFWSEKYFGSRLHIGYAVRRIAVVAVIILSLLTVNEVSARVFGFRAWEYKTSFLRKNKMDIKDYTEPLQQSDDPDATEVPAIIRDIPLHVPENFEQSDFDPNINKLYVEWENGEKYLQYIRIKLSKGQRIASDAEYQLKEKISIHDFVGDYYVKGEEAWIDWDDASYKHVISAANVEDAKEVLMDMAESLYQ